MPLIRRLDHVAHGSGRHFSRRALSGGTMHYQGQSLAGGSVQHMRYGERWRRQDGGGVMGRGIMGRGVVPVADTIPTPYNVQLPGGRMKRPSEMTKERVIAKLQKLTH